ncbi:MAG TPA: hypothetical protein VIB79_06935 [Candidatus Binatia bacterium]
MDAELTFKLASYGLIELLWITGLAVSLVSIRKESRCGEPIKGCIALTVALLGFCAFVVLLLGYGQNVKRAGKNVQPRVIVQPASDALPQ